LILNQAPYPSIDAAGVALAEAQGALALVTAQADIATTQAGIATAKAALTAADAASTADDVVLTHADVGLTHADVVLTHADAAATAADALATAADRVQAGLDAVATAADRVQTGLDAATSTTQAGIATSAAATATTQAGVATAKAVLTAADVVSTNADAASTAADAIATAADRVQTGLDAATATTQASNAATSASNAATSEANAATAAATAISDHVAETDPHTQYATDSELADGLATKLNLTGGSLSGWLAITDTAAAVGGASAGTALAINQTWNTTGTPTAIKLDVTDTASNASSLLMDLQVGGISKVNIRKDGVISSKVLQLHSTDTTTAVSNRITFKIRGYNNAHDIYYHFDSASQLICSSSSLRIGLAGVQSVAIYQNGWQTKSLGYYGWSQDPNPAGNPDVKLYRDAAGVLAQLNGTNAQTFRLYNTYTDASNYERGFMRWNANVLEIGAEAAGTGVQRNIGLQTAGGNVGIGTAVPTSILDIRRADATIIARIINNVSGRQTLQLGQGGGSGWGTIGGSDYNDNLSRLDLCANQIFLSGTGYTKQFTLLRLSDATSTATQADSDQLRFQNSFWTGSSKEAADGWAVLSVADTTANYKSKLSFRSVRDAEAERMAITSDGYVLIGGALQLTGMTAPAAPATNDVRLYAEDDGAGKTRLMALFATGAAVQIAIEP